MDNKKVVAVYSFGLCGLEIMDIINSIDDYVIYRFCGGSETETKLHKAKIYYNTKEPYFNYNGKRIRLSECLRV